MERVAQGKKIDRWSLKEGYFYVEYDGYYKALLWRH
jgi:hypothetical protein